MRSLYILGEVNNMQEEVDHYEAKYFRARVVRRRVHGSVLGR